jgi:hypothetical protein
MEGFLNKKYGIFQKTGKTPFVDYFELEEQHFMDFALLPTPLVQNRFALASSSHSN